MKRDLPQERILLLRPDDLCGLDEARIAELRSAFIKGLRSVLAAQARVVRSGKQRDPDGRWADAGWRAHGFFGKRQKVAIGLAGLATLLAILTRLLEREAVAIFGGTALLVVAIAAVPQVAGRLDLHVLDAADIAVAVAAGVLGAAPSIMFDGWSREGRRGNG